MNPGHYSEMTFYIAEAIKYIRLRSGKPVSKIGTRDVKKLIQAGFTDGVIEPDLSPINRAKTGSFTGRNFYFILEGELQSRKLSGIRKTVYKCRKLLLENRIE